MTKVKPQRLNVTWTPSAGKVPAYVSPDEMERVENGGGWWDYNTQYTLDYDKGQNTLGFSVNNKWNMRYTFAWESHSENTISLQVKPLTGWYDVTLNWDDIEIMEFEAEIASNAFHWFCIWFWVNNAFEQLSSVLKKVVIWWAWARWSGTVTINTADWTTQSTWSGIPETSNIYNKYKLIYYVWVKAELYINWVLVQTKTTNLPTWNTEVKFWMWVTAWPWYGWIQNTNIKIKYS